ncbi:hypothetical protein PT974_06249 [Cladobotryum mycophilum]|uniref:Secreted protein n=1 Tax=Cladobotryum mycophilum TaxID=491253 RepID=A0ABR0SL02_9HYPO
MSLAAYSISTFLCPATEVTMLFWCVTRDRQVQRKLIVVQRFLPATVARLDPALAPAPAPNRPPLFFVCTSERRWLVADFLPNVSLPLGTLSTLEEAHYATAHYSRTACTSTCTIQIHSTYGAQGAHISGVAVAVDQ